MADERPQKTSQGTDMTESLRYPDAIEYEQVIKNCNLFARPIASREVCNKCYNLLWRVANFSSSVSIGVCHVMETLECVKNGAFPCLVMIAADAFIDDEIWMIVDTCKERVIPYIFLPTKTGLRDALHVDKDVVALCIVFYHDPGMMREFEDCFNSIKSQCYKKRKSRSSAKCLASTSTSVPPEIGPRGEMPLQVTEAASSVGRQHVGSESEWMTVRSNPDREYRDFSVNVPDESGNCFTEVESMDNRVRKCLAEPTKRNLRFRLRHSPKHHTFPMTGRRSTSAEQATVQEDKVDLDAGEEGIMDLSAISNEQVLRQQQKPMSDLDLVNVTNSSNDDVLMAEEASSNLQNEGAAGDRNIRPIEDTSAPSSLPSTIEQKTESDGYPLFVEETKADNTASTARLESLPSTTDLDNYYSDTSSSSVSCPGETNSFSSDRIINLEPSSSNLFAFSDPPSVESLSVESALQLAPTDSGVPDDAAAASAYQGNVPEVNAYPGEFGDQAAALPEDMARQLSGEERDVPAVHAQFGELGDAAAGPPSASRAGDFGDPAINMPGTSRPSAFGDAGIGDGNAWRFDVHLNDIQIVPHRVTGTGEGGEPAFMPPNISLFFAPRIVYMAAAGQDGRRRGAWDVPREEDILNIPFPGEDQSSRSSNDPDRLSARTFSEADSGSYYDDDDEDEEVENVNPPTTPTEPRSEE